MNSSTESENSDPDPLLQLDKDIRAYARGLLDAEGFRRSRVRFGIYRLRGSDDRFTVRIRVPAGLLYAAQLETAAAVARDFSSLGVVRVTARQDLEIHGVRLDALTEALRTLDGAGLTTVNTGGHAVRNIVCCPRAGIAVDEKFDVTPYALALDHWVAGSPEFQDLPAKVKIAVEGCPEDHVHTAIHDIGVTAVRNGPGRGADKGFRIFVGGGLGASPRAGELLEPFTPAAMLIPTCEAILRLFDRFGDRKRHDRGRLKHLIREIGIRDAAAFVERERETLPDQDPEPLPVLDAGGEPPAADRLGAGGGMQRRFGRVIPQDRPGLVAVHVVSPTGDLPVPAALALARITRDFAGGALRTTPERGYLLRGISGGYVPELMASLRAADLGVEDPGAEITCCAGAATCISGITNSRALSQAIRGALLRKPPSPGTPRPWITVSGCPHACGQHTLGSIGLHGTARRIGGRLIPHYRIFVGGAVSEGKALFGIPIADVPARRAPEAVVRLIRLHDGESGGGLPWRRFLHREGIRELQSLLGDLAAAPESAADPDLEKDWGSDRPFAVGARKGECSA